MQHRAMWVCTTQQDIGKGQVSGMDAVLPHHPPLQPLPPPASAAPPHFRSHPTVWAVMPGHWGWVLGWAWTVQRS